MMKIRIIELLNKIANGEEVPERIIYKNIVFELNEIENYFNEETDDRLLDYILPTFKNINDYVEILEDNTEEIEELNEEWTYVEGLIEKTWSISELELVNKINEIIKYIKKKEKK